MQPPVYRARNLHSYEMDKFDELCMTFIKYCIPCAYTDSNRLALALGVCKSKIPEYTILLFQPEPRKLHFLGLRVK